MWIKCHVLSKNEKISFQDLASAELVVDTNGNILKDRYGLFSTDKIEREEKIDATQGTEQESSS